MKEVKVLFGEPEGSRLTFLKSEVSTKRDLQERAKM
jgi:hypothetical protein